MYAALSAVLSGASMKVPPKRKGNSGLTQFIPSTWAVPQ